MLKARHQTKLVTICLALGAAAAVVLALLGARSSGEKPTREVAPEGRDAGDCLATPCASLRYAYQQSAPGDVVRLAAGTYPAQRVPRGRKAVTFRGGRGTKLRALDNYASSVVFDGIEVDGGFARNTAFENRGARDVTFKNGRIGNVTDEKGALVSGRGFSFENVVFHDVRSTRADVHNECVYAIGVPRMSVRRSSFRGCATMDLFFTYGSWWDPRPPGYGRVTLENNVFERAYKADGSPHYYSLFVGPTGPRSEGGGSLDGWVVRNNTFETTAAVEKAHGSGRWVGNLGTWSCVPGVSYGHNVGQRCSARDNQAPGPYGWRDASRHDFRLRAGSPAIDAGDPADHPATDRDGKPRSAGTPDAGAYESGPGR